MFDLEKRKDSISYLITKENVYRDHKTTFPNITEARVVFDIVYDDKGKRFNALSNAGLSFGDRSGSVYSDLVNGNVGLIRASLGAMVTSSNSPDKEEAKLDDAYQRLVTYGVIQY